METPFQIETKLFCKYLPLIRGNAAAIQARRQWALCHLHGAFISIAYVSGGGFIPLGLLLQLWERGVESITCPQCGGRTLFRALGGSPLSGSHKLAGICEDCREIVIDQTRRGEFIHRAFPIAEELAAYLESAGAAAIPPAEAETRAATVPLKLVLRELVQLTPELAPEDTSDLYESAESIATSGEVAGGFRVRGRRMGLGLADGKMHVG